MPIILPVLNTAFQQDQLLCDVSALHYDEAPSFHERIHIIIPTINRWKTLGFDCRERVNESYHSFTPVYPTLGSPRYFAETNVTVPLKGQNYKITYHRSTNSFQPRGLELGTIEFSPTQCQESSFTEDPPTGYSPEDEVAYFVQPSCPTNLYRFKGQPVFVLFNHCYYGGKAGDFYDTIYICFDADGKPAQVWCEGL